MREITIDNSVKHIPRSEPTKERDTKPNTIKNLKQDKNISQSSEKFPKGTITGERLRILKRIMNCCF